MEGLAGTGASYATALVRIPYWLNDLRVIRRNTGRRIALINQANGAQSYSRQIDL